MARTSPPSLQVLSGISAPPLRETTGMPELNSLSHQGVFLRPGDWFFGRGEHGVTTVLGSCVSLVMWCPRLRLGAMSHCLLPTRSRQPQGVHHGSGHYLDEALQWMTQRMHAQGCGALEIDVSIAGGAMAHDMTIGQANVTQALTLVEAAGLRLVQQDTGGQIVRRLTFNLSDGCLTISHGGRLGSAEV